MREYKFRAWDNDNKRMLYPHDLYYEDLYYNQYHKHWRIDPEGTITVWGIEDGRYVREKNISLELMQYIGLKDKNGTEIYEDDLVKVINKILRVLYDQSTCSFIMGRVGGYYKKTMYSDDMWKTEVIGNAHTNPELL
jgi:uncharacterized phage protein (TIGR01671 family)